MAARVAASYLLKKSTSRETGIGARRFVGCLAATAPTLASAWSFRKETAAGVCIPIPQPKSPNPYPQT